MRVCTTCRRIVQQYEGDGCNTCGTVLLSAPYRWSPPKNKDKRAWRRIAKGEWLWDRRRVARQKMRRDAPLTRTVFETRKVSVPHECVDEYCSWHHQVNGLVRIERIPGSEREIVNQYVSPDIDMGG